MAKRGAFIKGLPQRGQFIDVIPPKEVRQEVDEIAQQIMQNKPTLLEKIVEQLSEGVKAVGRVGPAQSHTERMRDLQKANYLQNQIAKLRGDTNVQARVDRIAAKIIDNAMGPAWEQEGKEGATSGPKRSILGTAASTARPAPSGVASLGDALKEGSKRIARDSLHFGEGVAEFFANIQKEAWNQLPEETKQALAQGGDVPDDPEFPAGKALQEFADKVDKVAKEKFPADKDLDYGKGAGKYLRKILEIGPQVGTQILSTLVGGPTAGLATIGTQIAGGTYESLEQQGVDPIKAFESAAANAIAQGGLEQLGIGKALKGWKPSGGAKKALTELTERFGTEWFTEFAQAFPDAVSRTWGTSDGVNDFLTRLGNTDWAKVSAQGAKEGALTAPYALLGMGLSAKVDKETGRLPDEVLAPEQRQNPDRDKLISPTYDADFQATPNPKPTRRKEGAAPPGAKRGQLVRPLGLQGQILSKHMERTGEPVQQAEPTPAPTQQAEPAVPTQAQQDAIDGVRQAVDQKRSKAQMAIFRAGDEVRVLQNRRGEPKQFRLLQNGRVDNTPMAHISEDAWDEVYLDNRPKRPEFTRQEPGDNRDGTYRDNLGTEFTRQNGQWFNKGKKYRGRKGLPSAQELEDFATGRDPAAPIRRITDHNGNLVPFERRRRRAVSDVPAIDNAVVEEAGQKLEQLDRGEITQQQWQEYLRELSQNDLAGYDDYTDWRSHREAELRNALQITDPAAREAERQRIVDTYKALARDPEWLQRAEENPQQPPQQAPEQSNAEKWLSDRLEGGLSAEEILRDTRSAVERGEITDGESAAISGAIISFEEAAGHPPFRDDIDEVLSYMDKDLELDKGAAATAGMTEESIAQLQLWRDYELDLYDKGIRRIRQMGGLSSGHVNREFGEAGLQELRSNFGREIVKKDGWPLDVIAQNLASESPELGIEPGGDIASLWEWLTNRAKSKAQIDREYRQALDRIEQTEQYNVGESSAKYRVSKSRRTALSTRQPTKRGNLHAQRPVSMFEYFQPEQQQGQQKTAPSQIKDPQEILDDAAEFYGKKVKQVRAGSFQHDGHKIQTGADVARLTKPLAQKAQENFVAVLVDKNQQPVAVLRHTIGTGDQTPIDAKALVGSVSSIPGVHEWWIVHNHPSGKPNQSPEDLATTNRLAGLSDLQNSATFRGSVVVASSGKASTLMLRRRHGKLEPDYYNPVYHDIEANLTDSTQTAVPFLERELGDGPALDGTILQNPKDVGPYIKKIGKDKVNGIIFVNSNLEPVAHLTLSKKEMAELRSGGKTTPAHKIFRTLARSNANGMFVHFPQPFLDKGTKDIVENFRAFAKKSNVRLLDAIVNGESLHDQGYDFKKPLSVDEFFEPKKLYNQGGSGPPQIPGDPDKLMGRLNSYPVKKFMAGGATDEHLNAAMDDIRAQAKRKGQKLTLSDKDINFIRAHTSLPYWLAKEEPDFAKVYEVQKQREQSRNVMRETLLDEARTFLEAKNRLSKKQHKVLNSLIRRLDRDRIGPQTIEFDRVVQELGVDNQVAEAYMSARHVLDFIWHEHMPAVLKELGHTDNEIEQYRRQTGNVAGYWPRYRRGRYFIRASKGDQALYREHFNDIIALLTGGKVSPKLAKKQKELQQKYPGTRLSAGRVKKLVDEIYFQVSPEAMDQVIDAALDKSQVQELADDREAVRSAVKSAVAEVFKQRGFMSHGIERQDVEGYDTKDPWEDFVQYVSGYTGFVTKMRHAPEFSRALSEIPARDKENVYQYATKYVRDVMQVSDVFDQTVDKTRGFLFHYYLGGSLKSAALQMTQNWVAGVPVLMQYTGFPEARIAKEMGKAAGRVVRDIGNTLTRQNKAPAWQRVLDEDETAGLNRARKEGVVDDVLTQELLGHTLGTFGSKLRTISNASKFFFGQAEIFNRETMWLTGFKLGREKGLNREAAFDFADQVTLDTHFAYGAGSLPPFARGGKVAKAARGAYTFRSYTHNLMSLYKNLAVNHQGAALSRALLWLLVFGGLGGIPLYDNMEKWLQGQTGDNVSSEVAERTTGWQEDLLLYGLPGLADIDLSGSISIEVPTKASDIPGVLTDAFFQMPRQVMQDLSRDDYWRAVEDFAPVALANPMKAYRLAKWGQTSRSGKPIRNDEQKQVHLTPGEAVRKGLGFHPQKLSEGYRRWEARRQGMEFWQKKKTRLLDMFHRAGQRHGYQSDKAQSVLGEIQKFNKQIPDYIAPITRRTLRARLRGPSRREEAAMQEFQ